MEISPEIKISNCDYRRPASCSVQLECLRSKPSRHPFDRYLEIKCDSPKSMTRVELEKSIWRVGVPQLKKGGVDPRRSPARHSLFNLMAAASPRRRLTSILAMTRSLSQQPQIPYAQGPFFSMFDSRMMNVREGVSYSSLSFPTCLSRRALQRTIVSS